MIAYRKSNGQKVVLGRLTSKGYETWDDKRRYIPVEELDFPLTDTKMFLQELHTLMEKYNASIAWCCSEYSDLVGINDSHIEISLNGVEDISFKYDNIDVLDVGEMIKNISE